MECGFTDLTKVVAQSFLNVFQIRWLQIKKMKTHFSLLAIFQNYKATLYISIKYKISMVWFVISDNLGWFITWHNNGLFRHIEGRAYLYILSITNCRWEVISYFKYFSFYIIRESTIEITLFKNLMINCILRKFIFFTRNSKI